MLCGGFERRATDDRARKAAVGCPAVLGSPGASKELALSPAYAGLRCSDSFARPRLRRGNPRAPALLGAAEERRRASDRAFARSVTSLASVEDHRADRFPALHQLEPFVDVLELQTVRDELVDGDLAVHVPVDNLRHIGAAAGAAEGRAFPLPAGDELERPRRDLGAGRRDADDDRLAPALVAALERLAHRRRVADALETVVGAAVGELDDGVDDVSGFLRIDEVRHAEFARHRFAARVDVDADDPVGADHPRALDDIEADAAEAEDDDIGTGLDLCREED